MVFHQVLYGSCVRVDLFGWGEDVDTGKFVLLVDIGDGIPLEFPVDVGKERWLSEKLSFCPQVPSYILEYILRVKLGEVERDLRVGILFDLGMMNINYLDEEADRWYVVMSRRGVVKKFPRVYGGDDDRLFMTHDEGLMFALGRIAEWGDGWDYYVCSEPGTDVLFNKVGEGIPISYLETDL